jgi:hypothetical protein
MGDATKHLKAIVSNPLQAFLNPLKTFKEASKVDTPDVKAPAVMPTPDDDAVKAAARRRVAAMQTRSGRVSTFLSDGDDKLGD